MNRLFRSMLAVASLGTVPIAAGAAGNVGMEMTIAHQRAIMSQGSNTLADAHKYMQQSINCMVGPKGAGFDQSEANPCGDAGGGLLVDLASNEAASEQVKAALASAREGLRSKDLVAVQTRAGEVASTLQKTGELIHDY